MRFDELTKQRHLETSLAQLALIVESTSDAIIGMTLDGIITSWNNGAEKIYGYSATEMVGSYIFPLFPSEKRIKQIFKDILKGERINLFNELNIRKDGKKIYVCCTISPIKDQLKNIIGISAIVRDVTEYFQAEEVLKKYQLVSNNALDIILFVRSSDSLILEANQAAVKAYGYDQNELLKMKMSELEIPPADEKIKIQKKKAEREEGVIYQTYHRRKDGSTFPVEVNCQGGVKVGDELILLKIIRDITERKLMEERLNYFALHDTITNLYNRTYFEQKMQSLEEEQASTVGIILCDLDGLKLVNDTMGHNTGDKLLQNAAKVIKKSFRENDVVARIGGDEFAILLPDCNEEDVEKACLRIKDSIEKYNEMNPELPLSLSVGFAVRDKTSMKMSELFKEADNNMYQEKLLNTKSSRSTIIKTFKEMLKTRDFIIEGHAERLQNLVHEIGKSLGLNGPKINIMMLLAEFHDIGKIGIPENILLKKAALTSQERKTLQRHCEIGHRIAMAVPKLTSVADLILKHHEWWNGKGYPFGLKGKEIPLECRILAILDAYDAMTNDRPYRKAMTINEAIAELKRYSGIQFDPEIVDKFIKLL